MHSAAEMEVNHHREEIYFNKILNLVSPPTTWSDQFQQEMEHRISNNASTMLAEKVNKRRVNNTNRERVRQKRIREAFDVLRSVIPDYFSQREPGDRLSRIKTLRLAKKYIDMLRDLLERSQ